MGGAYSKPLEQALQEAGISEQNAVLIDMRANTLGSKSKGMFTVRGNGVLALTEEKLFFCLRAPKRILEIPVPNIRAVEECRKFNGKAGALKMVKVTHVREDGETDETAWYVKDRKAWMEQLERRCVVPK